MDMRQTLYRYKLHHLLIWLTVGAVWYYLRYTDYRDPSNAFWVTVIKTMDLAFLVYLTNYLLIPKLLYKKQYILFALVYVILIGASSIGKMYLIGTVTNNLQLLNWSVDG